MNIYGVFIIASFLFNVQSSIPLYHNKKHLNLFMKKQNTPTLNLYRPKTINQVKYVDYLNNDNNKIIITTGPAGTGKTLFACQKAITEMNNQNIDKIIITRPVVSVEEDIGFLPGNIIKKMDPWTKPLFDIFLEYFSKSELDLMLNNCKIEICPLGFMRGRTFKNAFIIADEMQNSSPNQMKMLTTRLGFNSRMVITGDLNQTDIIKDNGLYDIITKIKNYNNTDMIKLLELENNDIERSEIVKKVIELYEYKKTNIKIPENTNITGKISTTNITNTINTTKTTNTTKPINNYDRNNGNNDAALIPLKHFKSNFDIFFEYRDF
jgi:phosphate starvation-inducible PhoH-like protein